MKYEVVLTSEAQENARAAYDWYAERSQEAADKWHAGLLDALTTLETDPSVAALLMRTQDFPSNSGSYYTEADAE